MDKIHHLITPGMILVIEDIDDGPVYLKVVRRIEGLHAWEVVNLATSATAKPIFDLYLNHQAELGKLTLYKKVDIDA